MRGRWPPARVSYTADVGTTALPEFIHGAVRAEYSIRELPPLSDGKRRLRELPVVRAEHIRRCADRTPSITVQDTSAKYSFEGASAGVITITATVRVY